MAATQAATRTRELANKKALRRAGEDTSHTALMRTLDDAEATATLFSKVSFVARARYGIALEDAEDIFHEAVATYLTIHGRYPAGDNHFGLLVGVFHKKSLEHLGSRERDGRVTRRLVTRLQADRPSIARGEDPKGAALERVIRREDAHLIRAAISSLNDEGRDLLLTLAEGKRSRLELIEDMGLNRNTFDTRLRSARLKLRARLERKGVL